MKTVQLGDVFEYNGQIVKCEWINTGSKSIGFKMKEKIPCPHCGKYIDHEEAIDLIESSPIFQQNATAVKTISEI